MSKKKNEILKAVEEAAVEGKLPCVKALALAGELGVAPKLIGEAADELKIKIKACQLGCFK